MALFSDLNSISPTLKPLLTEEAAVYQSIYNIFNTKTGERLFLPEFGLDLDDELFGSMDNLGALTVFTKIIDAVERWEPRVAIDKAATRVTASPDQNTYSLYLVFSYTGSGQKFQINGSFAR